MAALLAENDAVLGLLSVLEEMQVDPSRPGRINVPIGADAHLGWRTGATRGRRR